MPAGGGRSGACGERAIRGWGGPGRIRRWVCSVLRCRATGQVTGGGYGVGDGRATAASAVYARNVSDSWK
ncbi:hypothetical protein Psuf_081030 [Phytohabitans suffuscus]|uniref:Uncharacterized protein n=1 Tax=Phytohabitans suffuscus TaxID=624315 RepID=A0A6F8YX99_9ACTN|nr:hypothetical protein Psuf_081030 [Phytohabitans suffuscus]